MARNKPDYKRAESFPPVDIKTWPSHCVQCKKEFQREDRVTTVFIIAGVGWDSETNKKLPAAGAEYEMAHLNCADPKMNGGVISIVSGLGGINVG